MIFFGESERVESALGHRSLILLVGRCVQHVLRRKAGYYNMEDVLNA